jgi:hypothetical protein
MADDTILVNGVPVKTGLRLEDYGEELTLPSGRKARVRLKEPTGREITRVERALRPEDRDNFSARGIAMLAELVLVDGRRAAYEELLDFSARDLGALTEAQSAMHANPTSFQPSPPSPDSSVSASGQRS